MRIGLATALALAIAIGSTIVLSGDPPPVGAANLFFNASGPGGSCTRSDTLVVYNAATACRGDQSNSLELASLAAESGDLILANCSGSATMQAQTIDANNAALSSAVTFREAPGCNLRVGFLTYLTGTYATGSTSTINVDSTAGFPVPTALIIAGRSGAANCAGPHTATAFTNCTGGPNLIGASPSFTPNFFVAGAEVGISGGITVNGADWLTLDGIDANTLSVDETTRGSNHIRYLNATAVAGSVTCGDDILYQHVTFGPKRGGHPATFITECANGFGPTNLVFDDVTWTEVNANACGSPTNNICHQEAVFIRYANGLTFKNCRFFKTEQYDIFNTTSSSLGEAGQFLAQNVKIQNCFFGPQSCKNNLGDPGAGILFPCTKAGNVHIFLNTGGTRTYRNWTIENNSLSGTGSTLQAGSIVAAGTMLARGNYATSQLFNCSSSFTHSYNVTSGTACTGTGNLGGQTISFVDLLTNDLHLASAATAAANAVLANCPATDIDNDSRGSTCDAGADQFATSTVTGESQAVCSPDPCVDGVTPDSFPAVNLISLGSVNNGAFNETRTACYYVPLNLITNPTSGVGPPVVFLAGGGGGQGSSECRTRFGDTEQGFSIQQYANDYRVIVVVLLRPTAINGWRHPLIKTPPDDPAVAGSDSPYMLAVHNDICGPTPRDFNTGAPVLLADCERTFMLGASSGGRFVHSLICDPSIAGIISAYAAEADTVQIPDDNVHPTPSPTGEPQGCLTTFKNLFLMEIMGEDDNTAHYNAFCQTNADPLASVNCFTSFLNQTAFWADRFGCNPTSVDTPDGSPDAFNTIRNYTGCGYGVSSQLQSITVDNGGHGTLNDHCLTSPGVFTDTNGTLDTHDMCVVEKAMEFFAGTTT